MEQGRTVAVVVAAGSSARMGVPKLTLDLAGKTPLEMSLARLLDVGSGVDDAIIAVSDATRALAEKLKERYYPRVSVIEGGSSRTESVFLALSAVGDADVAAIHDAARCLVPVPVIRACVESAWKYGSGVAAARSRDTVRSLSGEMLDRDSLLLMQTPQAFNYRRIMDAYELARKNGEEATDDCALYIGAGYEVHYVEGSVMNQKLTFAEDIPLFRAAAGADTRIGYGEDTHRLVEGRKLVLGGVNIPYELGLLGHSDADVLAHAVMDALLGAAALGDIGRHFPDTDEAYRGICSMELLRRVGALLRERGHSVGNIDVTVIAERPKLAPYIDAMRAMLADALETDISRVSVKATTSEGMNDEGKLRCISARAVAVIH